MRTIILTSVILISTLISCGSGTNSDCDNNVWVEKVGTDFAKIEWNHSCMSCEKWEIKYDFDCFFCWFPLTVQVNTGGNAFQSNSYILTGLQPNKNYKATIYSVGSPVTGQPCVRKKIGKVTFSTN